METLKKVTASPNAKAPMFVSVYDQLYDDLINGLYKAGEQLLPESNLAEKYGVSRNTLRQALAILAEDGLIYTVQGKGNFVSPNYENFASGFEKLENPICSYGKQQCDEIKIDYYYSTSAKIVQEKINVSPSDVMLISNNYYFSEGRNISYSFVEIPVKFISPLGIDLNIEKEVHDLINIRIFEMASTSNARIKLTFTEEVISEYLNVGINTPVIFIEEILYNSVGQAIALYKYYLLPNEYNLRIIRKK